MRLKERCKVLREKAAQSMITGDDRFSHRRKEMTISAFSCNIVDQDW